MLQAGFERTKPISATSLTATPRFHLKCQIGPVFVQLYSNNIDAHFMWPLKQTVKRLIKGGPFLQAGLNNATVYFQPGIRHFSPARNPTPTGRVCFIFMILGLFQRVVISLLVAGGEGRHRATRAV